MALSVTAPSIQAAAGDILPANTWRQQWGIQNLGTNPLYVRMGSGASTTLFHVCLRAGAANDDGSGGMLTDTLWNGIISVAGTAPRFVLWEAGS
jgi:hypothetical protein